MVNGVVQAHVVFRCKMKKHRTKYPLNDRSIRPNFNDEDDVKSSNSGASILSLRDASEYDDLNALATMHEEKNFTYPDRPLVSPKQFCKLFPFHMLFDRNLVILQCGTAVQRMYGVDIEEEPRLDEIFTITHPRMVCTFENVLGFINASYVLEETATLDLKNKAPIQFQVDDFDTRDVKVKEDIFLKGKAALKGKYVLHFLFNIYGVIFTIRYRTYAFRPSYTSTLL